MCVCTYEGAHPCSTHMYTGLHVLHTRATIMLNFSTEKNEENTNSGALDLLKSECVSITMLYRYFSVISFAR
jgi:hypothetical protein